MCKSDVFKHVLAAVCAETEVPASAILSGDRRAETVDARYILTELCFRRGLYPCAIAAKTGLTVRAVNHILATFEERISARRMMRMEYEAVKNK